jgi:hypothetical protein
MYTLQGKIRLTRHTLSTLDSHMVPNHTSPMVRVGKLSLASTRTKHAPTPRRSLEDQRQTGLAVGSKHALTPRRSLRDQRLTDPVIALGHFILPPSRQPWSRGGRFWPSGYTTTLAYWVYNTSMRSIHSILAHGDQPIGP